MGMNAQEVGHQQWDEQDDDPRTRADVGAKDLEERFVTDDALQLVERDFVRVLRSARRALADAARSRATSLQSLLGWAKACRTAE